MKVKIAVFNEKINGSASELFEFGIKGVGDLGLDEGNDGVGARNNVTRRGVKKIDAGIRGGEIKNFSAWETADFGTQ